MDMHVEEHRISDIATLEHVYGEIRQAEDRLDLDHLAPVAAIRRIVEFTYDYYLAHEGFVRLVVAENQVGGRHLRSVTCPQIHSIWTRSPAPRSAIRAA